MKVFVVLATMIAFTVIANVLMKWGATVSVSTAGADSLLGFLNWRTVAGLASFGLAGLLYAMVLRWLPLNVAQSFAAGQFIAVIAASAIILSEPISLVRWVGILLIASGIAVVAWTTSA